MNLNKFSLSDQMHSALERNNINYVEEVMLLGQTELSRRTGVDLASCRALIDLICPFIIPEPLVPKHIVSLKTGLEVLDHFGGIPVGHLFEVYGEAGG